MSAYIVRDIESKALIGLFAAPTLTDLFWAVDQAGDPYSTEYTPLKYGGIFVDLSGVNPALGWPAACDDEGEGEFWYYPTTTAQMEPSDSVMDSYYNEWLPMPAPLYLVIEP